MKITDFNIAASHMSDLKTIDRKIEDVNTGKGLGLTIGGTYQSEEVVELVRPVVLAWLQKLRGEVLCDLTKVGVDVHE